MRTYLLVINSVDYEYTVGYRDDDDPENEVYVDSTIPTFKNKDAARQVVSALNEQERRNLVKNSPISFGG